MGAHNSRKLVWFRHDLRIHDNPALNYACLQSGSVRAVFVLCPKQWQAHHLGARHINLLLQAVQQLAHALSAYHIPLDIIHSSTFSQAVHDMQGYIKAHKITELLFNIEYELNERQRDKQILTWAHKVGIRVNRFHDQCLLAPGIVRTQTGSYFKVFSAFKKRYIDMLDSQLSPPLEAPKVRSKDNLGYPFSLPNLAVQEDLMWNVSETYGHQVLQDFLQDKAISYDEQRDIPFAEGTSGLSVFLALGVLSVRQCVFSAYQQNGYRLCGGQAGLDVWISELIWRDFYRHLLVGFPYVCQYQPFKVATKQVNWLHNPKHFKAWCHAQTGYPLIDAAMNQLKTTGFMHNRLRMLCAMFLSKHLLLDWREGEIFFSQNLVDIDFASNNGGWQWSASTGADSVPYFRIFNPITQSQKFDTQGHFIRQYLPQLSSLNTKDIHFPTREQRQALAYPEPIVTHKFARLRALEAFKI